MLRRSWLFLLPIVASLIWVGAGPSQAAGESWSVTGITTVGCADGAYHMSVAWAGTDGGTYQHHTTVEVGGLTYMNEGFDQARSDSTGTWGLFDVHTYGPTTGTWPIPAGHPVKVTLSLERPKGTVLSSWTMVVASCDSNTILYNGPTASDLDGDYVATPTDVCPSLAGFTADGCPVRARTLTLKAKYGPKRVVGTLSAPGYPSLYAGRTVTIWKVRPGPDLRVRTRITNSLGKFKAKLPTGRYYAMSGGLVVPSAGEATARTSGRARLR